jgi:hypothetical protein
MCVSFVCVCDLIRVLVVVKLSMKAILFKMTLSLTHSVWFSLVSSIKMYINLESS